MKKAGIIATVAAGVVLVGGGAWGATTLAAQPTATSETRIITAAPEASATPEATPTPTVEAAPVVIESSAPVEDPTLAMTNEEKFVYFAGQDVRGWGIDITDDELMTAGLYYCEQAPLVEESAQWEADIPGSAPEVVSIEGAGSAPNAGLNRVADEYLC